MDISAYLLPLVKVHVKADDFDTDDHYLEALIAAALNHIEDTTHRSIEELTSGGHRQLPPAIEHAARLLVGQWYDNREGVSGSNVREVPHAVEALLKPYVKLTPGCL